MTDEDDEELEDEDEDEEDVPEPEGLRDALAAQVGVDPASLFIEVLAVDVPGLTVFTAHAGRRSFAGVWDGHAVDLDPYRSAQRVTEAWGYGPARPVGAREVAQVIGTLEGKPGQPFLDDADIESAGDPGRMGPPVEVEVDGAPGVRFWNRTSRLSSYPVTYVVRAGRAEVTQA